MKLFAFALPDGGLKPLELDQIRRSKTDNDVLYADRTDITVDGSAIAFGDPGEGLAMVKERALALGAELREQTDSSLFFVWRSPTIGFPNGAYVYERQVGEDTTALSFYGRALYGRRDFGANKGFIDQVVSALNSGS